MSPSRGRNEVASSQTSIFVNEAYVLNFFVDVPRGETGENRNGDQEAYHQDMEEEEEQEGEDDQEEEYYDI
ncbi:hypothetical protein RYX36_037302 [Vicia faba]